MLIIWQIANRNSQVNNFSKDDIYWSRVVLIFSNQQDNILFTWFDVLQNRAKERSSIYCDNHTCDKALLRFRPSSNWHVHSEVAQAGWIWGCFVTEKLPVNDVWPPYLQLAILSYIHTKHFWPELPEILSPNHIMLLLTECLGILRWCISGCSVICLISSNQSFDIISLWSRVWGGEAFMSWY